MKTILVFLLMTASALAAEPKACSDYALMVAKTVKILTNDNDISQAAQARAEAYCIVLDEPPTIVNKIEDPHITTCKKRYRSYDAKTDTILRSGHKGRIRCPL